MGGNLWKTHLPTETTTLHRPNGSRRWKGRYLTKRQKLEEARPPETWLKVGQSSMVGTKWCCSGTSLGYFLQGSNWHSVAKFCSSRAVTRFGGKALFGTWGLQSRPSWQYLDLRQLRVGEARSISLDWGTNTKSIPANRKDFRRRVNMVSYRDTQCR